MKENNFLNDSSINSQLLNKLDSDIRFSNKSDNEKKRLYVVRNAEAFTKLARKNYFMSEKPSIKNYANAICEPMKKFKRGSYQGGIVYCGKFVAGLDREKSTSRAGWYGSISHYVFNEEDVNYVDDEVVYGGVLIGHFGHCILECFSRLWPIYYDRSFANKKFIFNTVLDFKNWYYDFFNLLGIDKKNVILINKITKFRSIIVPDEAVHSWFGFYEEYRFIYNTPI